MEVMLASSFCLMRPGIGPSYIQTHLLDKGVTITNDSWIRKVPKPPAWEPEKVLSNKQGNMVDHRSVSFHQCCCCGCELAQLKSHFFFSPTPDGLGLNVCLSLFL